MSALFNEVIFENGGNRKPVFYGQVPVKFIETLLQKYTKKTPPPRGILRQNPPLPKGSDNQSPTA